MYSIWFRNGFFKPFRFSLLIFICAATSCVTSPDRSPPESESGKPERSVEEEEEKGTGEGKNIVLEPGSASPLVLMWDTTPQNGNPVFFGIASRLRNREEEKQRAVEDAARQAAQFYGLIGRARFLKQNTTGSIGYLQGIEIGYDKELAAQLVERLEVTTEYQDNRATYVRAVLSLAVVDPIPFEIGPFPKDKMPTWIYDPPEIAGKLTGVGVAQRKMLINDSIQASDEKAVEELLKQVSITIKTVQSEQTIDAVGTLHDTTSLEEAEAELEGLYVLSRWHEANYYYTLAICNPPED